MMDYIKNANHASADYKQTVKRVGPVEITQVLIGTDKTTKVINVRAQWTRRDRHRHCHSRPRAYGLGNVRSDD